jgi:hypothetical protein
MKAILLYSSRLTRAEIYSKNNEKNIYLFKHTTTIYKAESSAPNGFFWDRP